MKVQALLPLLPPKVDWQKSAGKVHCNMSVKPGTVYPVITPKGAVAEREVLSRTRVGCIVDWDTVVGTVEVWAHTGLGFCLGAGVGCCTDVVEPGTDTGVGCCTGTVEPGTDTGVGCCTGTVEPGTDTGVGCGTGTVEPGTETGVGCCTGTVEPGTETGVGCCTGTVEPGTDTGVVEPGMLGDRLLLANDMLPLARHSKFVSFSDGRYSTSYRFVSL